jgi:hypothetical protein
MRGRKFSYLLGSAGVMATLAAIALPAPALAQGNDNRPSTRAIGEDYHVELSGGFWRPSVSGIFSSEQFGITGTDINFVTDLGFKTTRFGDVRLVLRPSKKSRFRFQYTPVSYSAESMLPREIVFNGIKYPVNLPVQSGFDWKVYRAGYEFDFFYTDRGFIGFLIEARYTEMAARLKSPLNDEASSAKGPLPAFGLVGRGYPLKNVSITAEVSGFKLPNIDEDYDANYIDIDIYGTVNFTHHFGVQAGWRKMHTFLKVEKDKGDFTFNGIWFGGAVRF